MATEVQTPTDNNLLSLAPHALMSSRRRRVSEAEHRANEEFLAGAYAPNTSRSYRSQLRTWTAWCVQRGTSPADADADTLVTYIRERAEGVVIGERLHGPAKPNSLNVACAAISKAYEIAGLDRRHQAPKGSRGPQGTPLPDGPRGRQDQAGRGPHR